MTSRGPFRRHSTPFKLQLCQDIYEGTTSIQSLDLIGRKLIRDQGQAMEERLTDRQATADRLTQVQMDGSVTAGNSSGINDGAAAPVLEKADLVAARGLTPLARIVAAGPGGVAPDVMVLGPVPATEHALERAGLCVADLAVIESDEAFPSD